MLSALFAGGGWIHMALLSSLFTIFAALILPLGAGIWLAARKKGYLKPVLLGVLTFSLFQGVRLWLNYFVLAPMPSMTLLSMSSPVLYFLFFGATAGLFEEGGRWLVMSLFMKDRHRMSDGIAFGVGHGGIEAILFAGISALALLILNDNSMTPPQIFASGIERIFAMTAQIALSVMVLKSVALKKPLWLLLAFVLHTIVDAGLVLQVYGASDFMMEAYVGIFAVIMLVFLMIQHKKYKGAEIQ